MERTKEELETAIVAMLSAIVTVRGRAIGSDVLHLGESETDQRLTRAIETCCDMGFLRWDRMNGFISVVPRLFVPPPEKLDAEVHPWGRAIDNEL